LNLHARLQERAAPIRVALIGAGRFGSMFMAQALRTPGLDVVAIADVAPARARAALERLGWPEGAARVTDDVAAVLAAPDVDVVVDATGDPAAGVAHVLACCAAAKHVVMVNVEADALAGPLLARRARDAGIVYSLAYGDQPALICELVDWARTSGFEVVAAGKGTKYLPSFHTSTPETVWEHYGVSAAAAAESGLNPQMFNSFLDGTKSAIEMAAVANATDLTAAPDGLGFPPCGTDRLASVLCPRAAGGVLDHAGQVEVVSSLERDGRPVDRDLRWGVYVTFHGEGDYVRGCLAQYGLATDPTGTYAAMYRPYHLVGLELGVSVASAAIRGEATGAPTAFHADVVATAKRDLVPGDTLDGEGGYTVYGRLMPAARSLAIGGLPIGLAHGVRVMRSVARHEPLRWDDVEPVESDAARFRREMEATFSATAPAG
jgi:predicted homoserine dehydrogenase-like protein